MCGLLYILSFIQPILSLTDTNIPKNERDLKNYIMFGQPQPTNPSPLPLLYLPFFGPKERAKFYFLYINHINMFGEDETIALSLSLSGPLFCHFLPLPPAYSFHFFLVRR